MDEQNIILLVGELKGGLAAVRESVDGISEGMKGIYERMNSLPCSAHARDLGALNKWKENRNGSDQSEKTEKLRGSISLRNALIIYFSTQPVTIGLTCLVSWLVTGKP